MPVRDKDEMAVDDEGLKNDASPALDPLYTIQLRSYVDDSKSLSDLMDLDEDEMAVDDEGSESSSKDTW